MKTGDNIKSASKLVLVPNLQQPAITMRDQSKPAPGSKEVDFALLDDETLDVSKLADFLKKGNDVYIADM